MSSCLPNMEFTKTKTHKNRGGKRYLFPCFKHDDTKTTDPLLKYATLAEKQGTVLPSIFSSALTAAKGGPKEGNPSRQKKICKDNSLRIRQALVAAFNRTSLGKKIINRRKTNNDTWSRSRIIELEGEGDNISNTEHKIAHETNSYTSSFSHRSPAFTPSSLSSSTCSSSSQGTQTSGSSSELYLYQSRSLPMNGIGVTKQKQDVGNNRKGCFGSNRIVCLLFLTSLLVLILWGKFYAILYTSIGFFMVPPCRGRHCNEGGIC